MTKTEICKHGEMGSCRRCDLDTGGGGSGDPPAERGDGDRPDDWRRQLWELVKRTARTLMVGISFCILVRDAQRIMRSFDEA